jgi:thioredoxin reductase (NADPH)
VAQEFDIAVIGGGITGLTAAHHAALAGASVVHALGAEAFGGLVLNVGALEGYPSGPNPLSGVDLASSLMEAGAIHGVEQRMEEVIAVATEGRRFRLTMDDGEIIARQVVAATGARLKMLDVPGAAALYGRGISQCAWCDAGLYKGKHAVVVGGGDAALEEALHLAGIAAAVTIVTRGSQFRARQAYVNRIADCSNVQFRWSSEVIEVSGSDGVESVRIKDRESGAVDHLACAGVFVFIGLEPNTAAIRELVTLGPDGAAMADARMATRTPGLYAAGAVRAGYGGRLVHAVSDGATAAMQAVQTIAA